MSKGKCTSWVLCNFEQLWGSTAIGLGDIGGQAMTYATTTIVVNKESKIAGVYFDGCFAYMTSMLNSNFISDLVGRDMKSVSKSSYYML